MAAVEVTMKRGITAFMLVQNLGTETMCSWCFDGEADVILGFFVTENEPVISAIRRRLRARRSQKRCHTRVTLTAIIGPCTVGRHNRSTHRDSAPGGRATGPPL